MCWQWLTCMRLRWCVVQAACGRRSYKLRVLGSRLCCAHPAVSGGRGHGVLPVLVRAALSLETSDDFLIAYYFNKQDWVCATHRGSTFLGLCNVVYGLVDEPAGPDQTAMQADAYGFVAVCGFSPDSFWVLLLPLSTTVCHVSCSWDSRGDMKGT